MEAVATPPSKSNSPIKAPVQRRSWRGWINEPVHAWLSLAMLTTMMASMIVATVLLSYATPRYSLKLKTSAPATKAIIEFLPTHLTIEGISSRSGTWRFEGIPSHFSGAELKLQHTEQAPVRPTNFDVEANSLLLSSQPVKILSVSRPEIEGWMFRPEAAQTVFSIPAGGKWVLDLSLPSGHWHLIDLLKFTTYFLRLCTAMLVLFLVYGLWPGIRSFFAEAWSLPPATAGDSSSFLIRLANSTRSSSMPWLDGLRGIAVLYVIFGHFAYFDESISAYCHGMGAFGVDLFFVLSSYLLTSLFIKALEKRAFLAELPKYAARRFLRIYPMFSFVLIILALAPSFRRMMFGGRDLNYSDQFFLTYAEGNFWAIGVEFEFYLILPVFALIFSKLRSQSLRRFYLLILSGLVAGQWHYNRHYAAFPVNFPHLPPYLYLFGIGMILAFYLKMVSEKAMPPIPPALASTLLVFGLFGQAFIFPAVGKPLATYIFGNENIYHFFAYPGGVTSLWAAVFLGIYFSGSLSKNFLSVTPLRWIGVVSYSAYLTHILTFSLLVPPLLHRIGFTLTFIVCAVATIALSTLTYFFIERPFLRIR